jgi:hypothetical protein
MWGPDNKIYFISDRDNRMNLFVVDLANEGNKAADALHGFRHQVPIDGQTIDRV